MGADCGYLALMSAIASGAEQSYFNEVGLTLDTLVADINITISRFENDCRYTFPLSLSLSLSPPLPYLLSHSPSLPPFLFLQSEFDHYDGGGE